MGLENLSRVETKPQQPAVWHAPLIYAVIRFCEADKIPISFKPHRQKGGICVSGDIVNSPIALRLCASLGLLASALFVTSASAAPQQLYNKSVLISFSVSISATGTDGSTSNRPRVSSRVVYVSSQGRVFVRALRTAGRNRETNERGPGEGGLQFAGNQLVGTLPFISGASRLTISFDPSFQSCSGTVIQGTESGKPFVFKGLNGVTYTATGKPDISAVSCSIREGNALTE